MRNLPFLFAVGFALAAVPALAADTTTVSPAEKLGMFAGSWHSEGTVLPGPKRLRVTGRITCAWSSTAHVFLVCDGVAVFQDDPTEHHQLSVYTYDTHSKQYGFASLTTNQVTSPDLALSGNTWTYSQKTTNGGTTMYSRTFNTFESSKLYRYRVESSADNIHWTLMIEGISRRL
ncbi:MAG: DUF1579 family protein [Candidatus Eremiobacteraeota bacterium]|nr:DUF1579 family protein [Candidatus Eremiobacteraeota bacterium]MBV9737913.1 DUF1579 family protein [Candidatus Eremiobacteraeota bacterium]